ncbi:MAG: hypothetical protein PHZ19_10375 [Candidatus Thermoplasmatota archaeon]|nr:hypothetical protein [Candidatus Thermoplasmatota archaeon]
MKAFLERSRARTKERREKREELFEQAVAEWPCEGVFARHLLRLWRETVWIERTGQFANGLPLNEQFGPELRVIETFLGAIVRRENYRMEQAEKGMPDDVAGPGVGSEPPPVDGQEWH